MKIAVVLLPKTQEPPLVLLDAKDQKARMFMIGRKEQFAFLIVLLVCALVIGYQVYDPVSRATAAAVAKAVPAVRVQRPQQVMFMEENAALEIGDSVFVPGAFAPSICKIAGLPSQSVTLRDAGAAARFLILGRDRYYVTSPDGLGQIVHRADLRQLVSN
jgi:hypothetical protein